MKINRRTAVTFFILFSLLCLAACGAGGIGAVQPLPPPLAFSITSFSTEEISPDLKMVNFLLVVENNTFAPIRLQNANKAPQVTLKDSGGFDRVAELSYTNPIGDPHDIIENGILLPRSRAAITMFARVPTAYTDIHSATIVWDGVMTYSTVPILPSVAFPFDKEPVFAPQFSKQAPLSYKGEGFSLYFTDLVKRQNEFHTDANVLQMEYDSTNTSGYDIPSYNSIAPYIVTVTNSGGYHIARLAISTPPGTTQKLSDIVAQLNKNGNESVWIVLIGPDLKPLMQTYQTAL